MTAYVFCLIGRSQQSLLEVDAPSFEDLAKGLSCNRFVIGRLIAEDGVATLKVMGIASSRIRCSSRLSSSSKANMGVDAVDARTSGVRGGRRTRSVDLLAPERADCAQTPDQLAG